MHTIFAHVWLALVSMTAATAPATTPSGTLADAARKGDAPAARKLLEGGADPNARGGKYGQTPLHEAADIGNEDVVQLLISHGAKVDATDDFRQSPLCRAAFRGHKAIVELLLAKGANPNGIEGADPAPLFRPYTPLQCAADGGRVEVGALLIAKGAKVNAEGPFRTTALFDAIDFGRSPEFVKFLLDHGADVNCRDYKDKTPLMHAAQMGLKPVVETLLADKNIDLRSRDTNGHSAAWWAKFKHQDIYKLLVEKGVSDGRS